jgi:hypothetical protein
MRVHSDLGGVAAPLTKVENTSNAISRHLSLGDSIPGLFIAPVIFPTIPIIPGFVIPFRRTLWKLLSPAL